MFTLSAFADEISMDLTTQMEVLDKYSIKHIEMRGVNGKNLSDCTLAEAKEIKSQMDARGFSLSAVGSPIGKIGICVRSKLFFLTRYNKKSSGPANCSSQIANACGGTYRSSGK